MMNGVASQSMRDKGLGYKINWGIALPALKEMAAEYGKDYAEFYRRCITALRLAENEIHCIVEVKMSADLGVKASEYEYVVLNRQTGKVKEKYLIGKQQPDDFVIAVNLTFDKTPLPFYLCRRGDKYVVVFVDGKNL